MLDEPVVCEWKSGRMDGTTFALSSPQSTRPPRPAPQQNQGLSPSDLSHCLPPRAANSMSRFSGPNFPMKIALLLICIFTPLCALGNGAPVTVFTRGGIEQIASYFKTKGRFIFEPVSGGTFKAPDVSKWAILRVPKSIRGERKEHNVSVGVILSDKGKVLAQAVVSSDCKDLEEPAIEFVKQLEFNPAKVDGKAICYYCVIPVGYKYVDEQ